MPPDDYNDMPPELREKEIQKALRRAAKLLVSHGIISSDVIKFPEAAAG